MFLDFQTVEGVTPFRGFESLSLRQPSPSLPPSPRLWRTRQLAGQRSARCGLAALGLTQAGSRAPRHQRRWLSAEAPAKAGITLSRRISAPRQSWRIDRAAPTRSGRNPGETFAIATALADKTAGRRSVSQLTSLPGRVAPATHRDACAPPAANANCRTPARPASSHQSIAKGGRCRYCSAIEAPPRVPADSKVSLQRPTVAPINVKPSVTRLRRLARFFALFAGISLQV